MVRLPIPDFAQHQLPNLVLLFTPIYQGTLVHLRDSIVYQTIQLSDLNLFVKTL